jgi:hypothetical protein
MLKEDLQMKLSQVLEVYLDHVEGRFANETVTGFA